MNLKGFFSLLLTYLKLMRVQNGLIASIAVFVTSIIATRSFEFFPIILLGAWIALLIMGGGNALNDYFDHEIDKMSHPERPIPSGKLKRKHALYFSMILFVLGILLGLFLNALAFSIIFMNTIFLILYARYSKFLFIAGNLIIGLLTASVFVFTGAILSTFNLDIVVLAASAFLVMTSREVLKDIQDREGDLKLGAKTLPLKIGVKKARSFSTLLIVLAVAVTHIPYVLKRTNDFYLVGVICTTFVLFMSFFLPPRDSQRVVKLATLLVMGAFVVGVL